VVAVQTDSKKGSEENKDDAAGNSEGERPLSQEEQIKATQWRVLRDVALIALLQGTGQRTTDLTLDAQNDLLEPLVPTLVGAAGMLRECGHQFYLLGVSRVHLELHGQPGIDHALLDEAVDYHSNQQAPVDDEPFILER
jgi:hypothetical protein